MTGHQPHQNSERYRHMNIFTRIALTCLHRGALFTIKKAVTKRKPLYPSVEDNHASATLFSPRFLQCQ